MDQVIFLILRRMRMPLLVLLGVHAVSVLGFVLIPGVDEQGDPWQMGFFHAIYFVSYMATTIGFGEIPHAFTNAQRLWALASMYLTVIGWLYAIGKILALIQEAPFRQAVVELSFMRRIKRLAEPFYIVCGYGDTGRQLVAALVQRGMRPVVIDINPGTINGLELADLQIYVPGVCADASRSQVLREAGLMSRFCAGVVSLTDNDQANLTVAITVKLLRPDLPVLCRAETHDVEANMRSFGTDYIINPYDKFAARLALALHSPGIHLLYEWLTGAPGDPLPQPLYPEHGTWVVCGYGRFGQAVDGELKKEGIKTVIIESNPQSIDCVVGLGTEAETLNRANIHDAVGIVAGTDDDTTNLSIIMTARELNPGLFMVARQNHSENAAIFHAAGLDLVMQRSQIMAHNTFARLTTPLLADFFTLLLQSDSDWANQLVSRISAVVDDRVPHIWVVGIDSSHAPAVFGALDAGISVRLGDLSTNASSRDEQLPCVPLLIKRKREPTMTPDPEWPLQGGDQVLFVGHRRIEERMKWTLRNENALRYVLYGDVRAEGYIWRWLTRFIRGVPGGF